MQIKNFHSSNKLMFKKFLQTDLHAMSMHMIKVWASTCKSVLLNSAFFPTLHALKNNHTIAKYM